MDYKYKETQADLVKLKSAMDFIQKSTHINHDTSISLRGKQES